MKIKYLIISLIIISSCTNNIVKKTSLNNLNYNFIDSIRPSQVMKEKGYITYNVEISGFANDTIILNIDNNKKESNIYLKGKFNERFVDEFLGKSTKYISIKPYKSTKNKITIKYGLYK